MLSVRMKVTSMGIEKTHWTVNLSAVSNRLGISGSLRLVATDPSFVRGMYVGDEIEVALSLVETVNGPETDQDGNSATE